jgi:hypothetical protein
VTEADAILEAIVERIAREIEERPPVCAWCLARCNGSGFCNDYCRDQWRKHIMPWPGVEQHVRAPGTPSAAYLAEGYRAGLASIRPCETKLTSPEEEPPWPELRKAIAQLCIFCAMAGAWGGLVEGTVLARMTGVCQ